MKNTHLDCRRILKLSGLVFAIMFICIGVQARESGLAFAVIISNAAESSVSFGMFFKFFCTAMGLAPVVFLLNYATTKTMIIK